MKPDHLVVLAMTILAAILTTAVLLDGPAAVTFDAKSNWQFGESVAVGDWFLLSHPIAYRTPAYPWFVALCQWAAGSHGLMLVVVLQGALSVLLVPLNAWLAARLAGPGHSRWAAMATAALTAIGISRLYFARALLSETLFLFAMMLHIACIVGLATGRARMRWAMAAGLLLGLTVLVRPVRRQLRFSHGACFRRSTSTGRRSCSRLSTAARRGKGAARSDAGAAPLDRQSVLVVAGSYDVSHSNQRHVLRAEGFSQIVL